MTEIEIERWAPLGTVPDSQIGTTIPIQKEGEFVFDAVLISARVDESGTRAVLTLRTEESLPLRLGDE